MFLRLLLSSTTVFVGGAAKLFLTTGVEYACHATDHAMSAPTIALLRNNDFAREPVD